MQAGNGSAARQRPGGPIWSQAAERFPPADRVLSTILTRQAAQYRDRTLFVFGETRWSYAETAAIAAASAGRLLRAGVQAGDRVALMCSNRPEFLEVYLGCAWMGAVTVPINTALRGIQLSHILRNSTPKLLVIELLSDILCAIAAAIVVSRVAGGYGKRLLAVTLMGFFAWAAVNLAYWNWYAFPGAYTMSEAIDQIGGAFFGGLVIAKMVKGPEGRGA